MYKKLHLLIVALLTVTLLSACGGSNGDNGDEAESELNSSGQASVGELFGGNDDDENEPEPESEDTTCPPIDDPVCAQGNTYANACFANAAGEIEWKPGACSDDDV